MLDPVEICYGGLYIIIFLIRKSRDTAKADQ